MGDCTADLEIETERPKRLRLPVDRYQIYPPFTIRRRSSEKKGSLSKRSRSKGSSSKTKRLSTPASTGTPKRRKKSDATSSVETSPRLSSSARVDGRRQSLDSLESGVGSSIEKEEESAIGLAGVPESPAKGSNIQKTMGSKTQLDGANADAKLTDGLVPRREVCIIPVGRLVWARFTAKCQAWPGVTILGEHAAQDPAAENNMWVFWFGDHQVSEVPVSRIEKFGKSFTSNYIKIGRNGFKKAVKEVLKDVASLLEADFTDMDFEASITWAHQNLCDKEIPDGKLTAETERLLHEIRQAIEAAESSSDEEDSGTSHSDIHSKKIIKSHDKEWIRKRLKAVEDIETVCLSCESPDSHGDIARKHPLFQGGVCTECIDWIRESLFSFGADGAMSFCVVCGNGGELLVCDKEICGRTYCRPCLEILGSADLLKYVDASDPWNCLLCEPEQQGSNLGMLSVRPDWTANIISWYTHDSVLHRPPTITTRPKIRVLSLFDGIGTAKVVLDNLNVDVEVFYSSEIEEDAIQVVKMNHPDVHHLGDIKSLNEQELEKLGRIDLLVGGSPCNDLALVNPARRGLYDENGTGILFFDFYRILMTLNSKQPDHRPFWLFENVVHMNVETKRAICRFLECEPAKLDAGYFSAQSRARYFWGNIPGMYSPVSPEICSKEITLQDCLSHGRKAVVRKIRTVTTRGASLLQGKNEDTHAVLMNGQSDKLWPTELEKIFGLPKHYTDVGNLAPGKRQKLLGRSWCVPVIMYLLKPLTHIFASRPLNQN